MWYVYIGLVLYVLVVSWLIANPETIGAQHVTEDGGEYIFYSLSVGLACLVLAAFWFVTLPTAIMVFIFKKGKGKFLWS